MAGVERQALALRRHPLQPCRRRDGPPFGFRGCLAWLGSRAWRLQCGDVQLPDWEIGRGWRVGQCSSSGQACHSRTVGPGRLARIWVGRWGIKTFRTKKKIEELLKISKQCRLKSDSLPWKGMTRFAFQCFWLLFSDWLSIFRIFLPIRSSFWCRNQSSQLIKNSTQREHLNNSSGNVSILQLHCRMIYFNVWFDFYWIFQAHKPQLRQSNWIDLSKEHNVVVHWQVLSKKFISHCHTISYQCASIIADRSNTGQLKNPISYLLSPLRRQHHPSTSLTTTDPSLHDGSSRLLALADVPS